MLLSLRKINVALRLPVKCKTMCHFCRPGRGFVTKLFTLPLEWPDQTFISWVAVKLLCISKMLQWLTTYFQSFMSRAALLPRPEFVFHVQSRSHFKPKCMFPVKGFTNRIDKDKDVFCFFFRGEPWQADKHLFQVGRNKPLAPIINAPRMSQSSMLRSDHAGISHV